MKKVIGAVTIGQSPRTDVIPEVASILGPDVEIREAGALDGMSKEEIATLAPNRNDYVLVTRLTDGSSVQVAERHITPRIVEKINGHFRDGVSLVFLLCTGEFPGFDASGLLIRPQKILFNVVAAVGEGLKLGMMTPSLDQVEQSERRWRQVSPTVKSVPSSPYVDGMAAAKRAALELKDWGAQLVVMDCIGYTSAMQETVREIVEKPVILARGIAARTVKELVG
ncbi:MAG: AroM family protein [Synergistaceae bacterium]|jgi:protein AroM|nr:AroM family protein [Synergistaceae bacterium]